jgi:ribonuclease R|tara:strand:+ start:5908 stop:7176 length:1269 start_codon:yes stop_codon:yes gene_type:complete
MNEEREEKGGNDGPIKIPEEVYKQIVGKRESLLEKLGIVDQFPEDVIEEAKGWADGNKEEVSLELENRRDLRELTTWTTDPASAQDFDDALSITEEEKGYRIWVYIADVTHYVTPDTKTWKLAMERGNSTYMSGHTIHMLPRYLAEDVCSLVPGEDRLAHTVEMYINRDTLSYESIDIYKSVIRSDERLTYRECEKRLGDPDLPLHKECKTICEVTERLQKQRKDDGSLVLNQNRDRSHMIVEECMLKANKAVTHELMWNRGVEAMYRVHPQPTPREWDSALQEIQKLPGINIPSASLEDPRIAVNVAIEAAEGYQIEKIKRSVLKVMPRAMYMADPFGGHHALNFDVYGHFTSPIRRMSDLINHWIVHMREIPENIDELCKRAQDLQKTSEQCEREYDQILREEALDPVRIRDQGIEVIKE